MKFGKLNHVAVYTKSREESIKFYTEVFGGKLLYTVDNEDDGLLIAMIEMNGFSIEVLQPPTGREEIYGEAMNTKNHFAVEVEDIDKALAYFKEKGCVVEEPGIYDVPDFGKKGRNLRVAFIHGPDGERIELFYQNEAF